MKLVDRYLLREYLIHVTYCLLLFCIIFIVYDLFTNLGDILHSKVPLATVALYYACVMAPTIEYLAPASILLATLYTLWQLTRHNEFTAMRASGISLFRIMMPFLGVGLVFTIVTAAIKETVGPGAAMKAKQISRNDFKGEGENEYSNLPFYNNITRREWRIGKVDPDSPNRLYDVRVKQERRDGTVAEEITAKRAEWIDSEWWFYGTVIRKFDTSENPTNSLGKAADDAKATRMSLFTEQPDDFLNEIKRPEYLTSLQLARFIASHKTLSRSGRAEKRFDLHSRLALPWACLIVTLFGIPAGAKSGRQSALSGIFAAMAFFFGYYTLIQIGIFLGKREILTPWLAAWLSNIVFFVVGLVLMFRLK